MSSQSSPALAEGIRLLQTGDLPGAVASLTQAIQQDPQDGKAFGYLGIARMKLGEMDRGLASLQQAVRLQPNDTGALYNLAVALVQSQRPADARAALEHALTLEPDNQKLRAALNNIPAVPAAAVTPTAVVHTPAAPVAPAPLNAPQPLGAPLNAPLGAPQPPTGGYAPLAPQPLTGGPQPLTGGPVYAPQATMAAPSAYAPPGSAPAYGGQPGYGGPPAYGGAPGYRPPTGPGMAQPLPAAAYRMAGREPTAGQKIGRGLGWGALLGQAWTLYFALRIVLFSGMMAASSNGDSSLIGLGIAILVIGSVIAHAFMGAIMGLIIAVTNADDSVGGIIGIVATLLLMGGQYLIGLRTGIGLIIGIFFAVAIGRYIGAKIAEKVHASVGV